MSMSFYTRNGKESYKLGEGGRGGEEINKCLFERLEVRGKQTRNCIISVSKSGCGRGGGCNSLEISILQDQCNRQSDLLLCSFHTTYWRSCNE